MRYKPSRKRSKAVQEPEDAYIAGDLVTVEEAASVFNKTAANIRYYLSQGKISRYNPEGKQIARAVNGELRVSLREIKTFLDLMRKGMDKHHHAGLHPELGFYDVPERERTKHVHRLHPYLGKFIPQLVEWFLARYFKESDWILDPFMGSGTTLVVGNELKMNTVGIDISEFNCRIALVKTQKYDLEKARFEVLDAEKRTTLFSKRLLKMDDAPLFPDDEFEKLKESLLAECKSEYLRSWFAPRALLEMLYYRRLITKGKYEYKDLLRVLLSRAVRSSRLIPHNDLATPKAPLPVGVEYWCEKHKRMCKPIDNCITKIHAYSEDTIRRIEQFDKLRSDKKIIVLQGDSRTIDLRKAAPRVKFDGIFTSPPYVGQIDYHDQHIYAYELFGIKRKDELEIGPKRKGKSFSAQLDYVDGISQVFKNILPHLKETANIFVVANDKFKLYPEIAKKSGMKIVDEFHRAVTKRTEKGDDPYQETIFWMKKDP
ncbi:MAG TPA: DNA methyltransferase [Bacteroidota bacterium]|nr:DNA methyltransferase [Bacteroidota bacterium]